MNHRNTNPLTCEVTASGYDADRDIPQRDRVFWIDAKSTKEVEDAIAGTGATLQRSFDSVGAFHFQLPSDRERLREKLLSFVSLEAIATQGSITVCHDSSRGLHDSNCYDVTVKGPGGKLLIGTTAHDDELTDLVGQVMADELRNNVRRGQYVTGFTPLEIMGLRGSLAKRIATSDWSPAADASAVSSKPKARSKVKLS